MEDWFKALLVPDRYPVALSRQLGNLLLGPGTSNATQSYEHCAPAKLTLLATGLLLILKKLNRSSS